MLSPDVWKDRQIKNLQSVGEASYRVGIAKPKHDPIAAGIAAEDKYASGVKKAVDSKSRAVALGKTDMATWFKYTSEIGSARLVEGVTKREAKVTEFVRTFQPMLVDHLSKVDSLPSVTDKNREDKMLENLRGLRALKGKA